MTISQAFFLGFSVATLIAGVVFYVFKRWTMRCLGEIREKAENPLIMGVDPGTQDETVVSLIDQQRDEILGSFRIPPHHMNARSTLGAVEEAEARRERFIEQLANLRGPLPEILRREDP